MPASSPAAPPLPPAPPVRPVAPDPPAPPLPISIPPSPPLAPVPAAPLAPLPINGRFSSAWVGAFTKLSRFCDAASALAYELAPVVKACTN
ncbi:hypothetical protein DL240490_02456 [Mycobacterium marinum]|nr:hypothetical protein DL240490_02456 [Mycobacterium marinum]